MLILGSLIAATSASAISQRWLGSTQEIFGNQAVSAPHSDGLRVENLKTGKSRLIELPETSPFNEVTSRGNSDGVVFGSSPGDGAEAADLWLLRFGKHPKLLARVPRTGTWCDGFNSVTPFQLDKNSTVLAVALKFNIDANGCPPDVNASSLKSYNADGTTETIELPPSLQSKLSFIVAARGTNLLFQLNTATETHFIVYDFASGKTIWEGDRPFATESKLLAGNTIGSIYSPDDKPGWAERFNYAKAKTVHVKLSSGMTEFCGRFIAHAGLRVLTLIDQRGDVAYRRASGRHLSFGAPLCSANYLRSTTYNSVKDGTGSVLYQLLNLAKVK
jgi:hypothetical protein